MSVFPAICPRDPSLHFVSLWMTSKFIGAGFPTLCEAIRLAAY